MHSVFVGVLEFKNPGNMLIYSHCRYTGEGGVSNMAIIEVKMVSGWAVDKDNLKSLVKNKETGIRRYEVEKSGTIQLYFDSVSD